MNEPELPPPAAVSFSGDVLVVGQRALSGQEQLQVRHEFLAQVRLYRRLRWVKRSSDTPNPTWCLLLRTPLCDPSFHQLICSAESAPSIRQCHALEMLGLSMAIGSASAHLCALLFGTERCGFVQRPKRRPQETRLLRRLVAQ